MLSPICDHTRLLLGIAATLGGIVFAIMTNVLKNDMKWAARRLFQRPAAQAGEASPPPASGKVLKFLHWLALVVSFMATVIFGPYVAAVPSKTCVNLVIAEAMCNPPGDELTGEYVVLENMSGMRLNLNGWTLCDYQSRHCYLFEGVVMAPHSRLTVWTQAGSETETDLYFGEKQPIWTNAEDTAYLYDVKGQLIFQLPCP